MIDDGLASLLAAELDEAERARVPIEQISGRFPDITISDGYQISRAWVKMKTDRGQAIRGHKIGLTSRAMQKIAGLSEPDYGTLLDDMFFESGGDIPADRFIIPRVEIEIAFILDAPVSGPDAAIHDVLRATEFIVPSAEIIDNRVNRVDENTGMPRTIVDTIADNAANAGVVLGGAPARPEALDMRWLGGIIARNGVIEETGLAAGVLNHPANGVAWLANRLAPFGERLEAGHVVLGGSFTRPVEAHPGDVFHLDFGPLGTLAFRFV